MIIFRCPIHYLFHIYCPGCGLTRMILSIFKLDFYQAFRYNPYLFILFVLAIIYGIFWLLRYIVYKKKSHINVKLIIGIAYSLLAYMVLRNIPLFDFLAPTEINFIIFSIFY